ncbi:hypothetical protein QQ045_022174 [Rhodiola kirilowii]
MAVRRGAEYRFLITRSLSSSTSTWPRCRSTNLILCPDDYSRDRLMLQRIRNS